MSNEKTINIAIEISDSLCASILCSAIEGGTGYWAMLDDINRAPCDENFENIDFEKATMDDVQWPWVYVCALFADTEHDPDDEESEPAFAEEVVTYDTLRKGIERILSPGADIGPKLRGYVLAGATDNDGGQIDADAADAIVQFGMFGKLVFG